MVLYVFWDSLLRLPSVLSLISIQVFPHSIACCRRVWYNFWFRFFLNMEILFYPPIHCNWAFFWVNLAADVLGLWIFAHIGRRLCLTHYWLKQIVVLQSWGFSMSNMSNTIFFQIMVKSQSLKHLLPLNVLKIKPKLKGINEWNEMFVFET